MNRAACVVLLLCASCTVPSLEALQCDGSDPLTPTQVAGGAADAVLTGNSTACTGVKATVAFEGFKPGCVRLIARSANGDADVLSTEVESRGGPTGGSLVVAVLPPGAWGTSVDVEAQAFERTCNTTPVVSNVTRVSLKRGEPTSTTLQLVAADNDQDGYVSALTGGTDCDDSNSTINPGAAERCNDVDDNCNGQSDQVELQLGQSCELSPGCAGTRACGPDSKVICSVPNSTLAYPDVDRDGHGDKNATATAFCGSVPAGYTPGPNDDCDDSAATGANVYPGAPERCDGRDNDCDGPSDEDFQQLNQACADSGTQCGGTQQCNAQGTGTTCVVSQQPSTWYPDDDGDGYGRNTGAVQSCLRPSNTVSQGNDCDDGNPFTHPSAPEICDTLDNDCDSQPEAAAVCPNGVGAWRVRTEGSTTQNWYSVSTWTQGGVWAVGDNNRRAVLSPGDSNFTVTAATTNACGSTSTAWYSVWTDPDNNGRAYFGSSEGRLAWQDRTSIACIQVTATNLATYGLVGFRTNSVLEIYGASEYTSVNQGTAFRWDGATASVTFNPATNSIGYVYDAHGVSRNTLFAAGGYSSAGSGPRIYRYVPGDGTWQVQPMIDTTGLDALKGLWVVNDKLAFAVGDNGAALKWNGTTWSKLTFPNTDNLTSVVAFGASSVYATANNGTKGRVYRFNGTDWQQIHEVSNVQFNDIAGTSPADLWVVGNTGKILHWPQ